MERARATSGRSRPAKCLASYLWARVRPPEDTTTFEGWMSSRFGWRLYRIFFKTYTEKVWGVPGRPDARPTGRPSGSRTCRSARPSSTPSLPKRNQREITSLIEEFQYPRLGPGMMWETCRDQVVALGTDVAMATAPSSTVEHDGGEAHTVVSRGGRRATAGATRARRSCRRCPSAQLVRAMDPPAPAGRAGGGRRPAPPRLPDRRPRRPRPLRLPRQLDLRARRPRSSSAASRTSAPGRRTW